MNQAPNFSFCNPTDEAKWVENLPLTLLHMWLCSSSRRQRFYLSYMQIESCQFKKLFRLHEYIVNL